MHRWFGFVRSAWYRHFIAGLALLLGAFLVPVALVAYLYERAPVREVPLATVAICFLWGGALGTVIAGLLEYRALRAHGPLALCGAARLGPACERCAGDPSDGCPRGEDAVSAGIARRLQYSHTTRNAAIGVLKEG